MKLWKCPKCKTEYSYELETCSFCRTDLEEVTPSSAEVIAVTEIQSPPLGHEEVPYWTSLIQSSQGLKSLNKSDTPVHVGDTVTFESEDASNLACVGVLGSGVMGAGLAEHLLSRGHQVIWFGRNKDRLQKSVDKAFIRLSRSADEAQMGKIKSMLIATDSLEDIARCNVVIEAIIEETEPKKALLKEVEEFISPEAILATNTSGLSLEDLASVLKCPERFGALHFFNPVVRMKLVETAVSEKTSEETSNFLDDFAKSLGKTPVRVTATPAFAVNRALMPLINEGIRELEEGVAPAASIDEAIMLGLNHPMGPLALADLIGLDVCEKIMNNLAERMNDETYLPRPLLKKLVAEGKLGRKTGEGFYKHIQRPVSG